MRPVVSVLQLDTQFPRVPGDVACPDSYDVPVEILRISRASVGKVVTARPDLMDIGPFEDALAQARGEVIVTSCGFLAYWQMHLAGLTDRRFISSALTALDRLAVAPQALAIISFDAQSLNKLHLGAHAEYQSAVIGLPPDMHLRRIITSNAPELDTARVAREMAVFVAKNLPLTTRHILLECTNLPPYKSAIRSVRDVPITDILTEIELARPGTICSEFL